MKYPEYMMEYLYSRGYLITNNPDVEAQSYPFCGNWNKTALGAYEIYTHKWLKCYTLNVQGVEFFIIGHCYNPFSSQYDEGKVLKELSNAYFSKKYEDKLHELTGVFIAGYCCGDDSLYLTCDATGMLVAFYGEVHNHMYITSHSGILEDICKIKQCDYVERLKSYRFYGLFGKMLPSDLSPYDGVRHLIPNHMLCYHGGIFELSRYWPTKKIAPLTDFAEYQAMLQEASKILQNSLSLIAKKWPGSAAISVTGGCDSKTTLSCANGMYDKFSYYSYISSESEQADAVAAAEICKNLELQHKIYRIPDSDFAFSDIEKWRMLLEQNCGNIGINNKNDVRKRIFFAQHHDFDVEVKSWVSEVARAYYCKRFSRSKFPPKPTARYLTALYKVFFLERGLVRETDQHFARFLEQYYSNGVLDLVPWTDLIFWEYRMSSWNGLVISNEQRLSYDITIPYNNRRLLEFLLSAPQDKRIHDICHKDIQRLANPAIANMDIAVTNLKHTSNRAKLENLYLIVQSKLPF